MVEERKTRLKLESRALANFSTQSTGISSLSQSQRTTTEKKPPLAPSKLRLPLRGITNLMPPPSPVPPRAYKTRNSLIPLPAANNRENTSRTSLAGTTKTKAAVILKARRGSIAVRPSPAVQPNQSVQHHQPRRRASIATFRPADTNNANVTTPMNRSNARMRTDRVMGRQSFVWDPQRVWRTSRVNSPLQQVREMSSLPVEETPIGSQRSRKFMGSPPPSQQVCSWRPKHPTVIALQKKQLVWSPLKMKAMKNSRKSLLS